MLIAQITDIHLGFEPDNPAEFNRKRLDVVLRDLCNGPNRPDILLATGDIVDRGDDASYRRFRTAISPCPFPVWPCLGNHDARRSFIGRFPEVPRADGFVQYEIDAGPLRMIVIDTLDEGRHGGAFCAVRAAWLTARLKEAPDRPTAIVMHHPPFEAGIAWMSTHPAEPWVERFAAAIAGHEQVKSLICGHVHRAIVTLWRGKLVVVAPPTAPQVALDMRTIDPDTPDNRPMIIADAPGYALHWWNGRELVTHFESAEDHVMLAKYDHAMQPLVRGLIDERPR